MADGQNGAGNGSLEDIIRAQAETIGLLQKQMADIASRVPAAPEPVVAAGAKYPMNVYRAGGKKGQLDHPGIDTRIVGSESDLEDARSKGWVTADELPAEAWGAPEPVAPVEAPAPAVKGKK